MKIIGILIISIALTGCLFSNDHSHEQASHTAVLSEPRKNSEAGVTITAVYDGNTSEIKLHLHSLSGSLDYELDKISYIRDSNGNIIKPEAWKGDIGSLHIEGTLKFPKFDDSRGFELVIQNVAGVKERIFKW